MSNHYHVLLETPEGNLSRAMRQVNGVYTQRFNRRHERCGHVLQGRFGARLVDDPAYLHEVCRYIVLNPVRAGLVAHPREWTWSSFRATAGESAAPGFLTTDWVRSLAEVNAPSAWGRAYVRFVEAGIDEADVGGARPARSRPTTVGVAAHHLGEACRAAARDLEIPRAQRFATRPTLSDLFAGAATRGERNTRAVAAVRDHGYTMKAVADFLGRHYVTVSRALASVDRPLAREKMSECKT